MKITIFHREIFW